MRLWRYQNLNEDRKGNPKGSAFWNGRGWLRLWPIFGDPYGPKYNGRVKELAVQWLFGKHSKLCGIHFEVGGEEQDLHWSIAIPWLFSFYFSLSGFLSHRWKYQKGLHESYDFSIRVFDGSIWFHFFTHPWEHHTKHSKTPWWSKYRRDYVLHVVDLLLGRMQYTKKVLSKEKRVEVRIDDDELYYVDIEYEHCTWKRSRLWWNSHERIGGDIRPSEGERPIAVPGKWHDDDGLYGFSAKGNTPEEVKKDILRVVKDARCRRGYSEERPYKPSWCKQPKEVTL